VREEGPSVKFERACVSALIQGLLVCVHTKTSVSEISQSTPIKICLTFQRPEIMAAESMPPQPTKDECQRTACMPFDSDPAGKNFDLEERDFAYIKEG